MPQEMLREPQLPSFLEYHTLPAMSEMAKKLSLARKAVNEVRKVDDLFEAEEYAGEVSEETRISALTETARYCVIAFHAVEDAISILERVKADVESYRREL